MAIYDDRKEALAKWLKVDKNKLSDFGFILLGDIDGKFVFSVLDNLGAVKERWMVLTEEDANTLLRINIESIFTDYDLKVMPLKDIRWLAKNAINEDFAKRHKKENVLFSKYLSGDDLSKSDIASFVSLVKEYGLAVIDFETAFNYLKEEHGYDWIIDSDSKETYHHISDGFIAAPFPIFK